MMLGRAVRICDKNIVKRIFFVETRSFSASESIQQDVEKKPEVRNSQNHYDIVIVGGGMVGTTLASAIGNSDHLSDLSVLLLEASGKFKGFSGGNYSNRVSALNHNTIDLLDSIGAWNHISSARFRTVREMQVWDAISDAFITFNQEETGRDLAYIVENDLIVDVALKTLEKTTNVHIQYNSNIDQCSLPSNNETPATVTLQDGKAFTCNLLVGADGAKSLVRRTMNVNTFEFPYNQFGIVATLELNDSGGNSTAWQRFLPTGPVALLPLSDTLSSLVWSTTSEEAKKLLKLQPEEFVEELNQAFTRNYKQSNAATAVDTLKRCLVPTNADRKQTPPRVVKVLDNSRAAFPLGFSHASSYVANGVVLIGDAAHRIHPLAGQGVNLGFGDVKCLTSILEDAVCSGAKLGDLGFLVKYEKERLSRNIPIMLGTHGIQRLYNTDFTPVVLMRSIGLQVTQSIPFLKKLFMDRAMY